MATATPGTNLQSLVNSSPSGTTITLAPGSYHQKVDVPSTKRIHFVGDEATFDGTTEVTDWTQDGSQWWAYFDPTLLPSVSAGKNYPSYQLFNDFLALKPSSTRASLETGGFYYDPPTKRFYVADLPGQMTASDLEFALILRSQGSSVKGVKFHGYASRVNSPGAVRLPGADCFMEDCEVRFSAADGFSLTGLRPRLTRCNANNNRHLGIHGTNAQGFLVENVVVANNNAFRLFPPSESSGGMKLTGSRDGIVEDSIFWANYGHQCWLDVNCYNVTVRNNQCLESLAGAGIMYEISDKGYIVGNKCTGQFGIYTSSEDVWIWHNEVDVTDNALNAYSPNRTDGSWQLNRISVGNNVLRSAGSSTAARNLRFTDAKKQRTYSQMACAANGDLLVRAAPSSPTYLATVSVPGDSHLSTLAALQAKGLEANGEQMTTTASFDSFDVGGAIPAPAVVTAAWQTSSPTRGR